MVTVAGDAAAAGEAAGMAEAVAADVGTPGQGVGTGVGRRASPLPQATDSASSVSSTQRTALY